jgi:Helix-turn-helix domain
MGSWLSLGEPPMRTGAGAVVEVMKRADEMFTFERASSRTPMVETTWSTQSQSEESFISVAVCHWEMVVTRQEEGVWVTIRGPETRATTAPVPTRAEFFGIQFSHGTFMPDLDPHQLVDRAVTLPVTSGGSFWLGGSAWELPGHDDADVFVERLARAGLLVHDPVVPAALHDDVDGRSTRTVERRVVRATGLTRGTIRQIQRAEMAVDLLARGVPALDVVRRTGYADQPHMTRSLKRFVGQTPSRIAAGSGS